MHFAGDPFKDTSGPALNVLSKTMTMVALMLAPLYRSLGEEEGFDGFRPYGVIIAAVLLFIISLLCFALVSTFERSNKRKYEESVAKKKAADLKYLSGGATAPATASAEGTGAAAVEISVQAPAPAPAAASNESQQIA